MRKKLEGNGLWESSRMMLPEHGKALNYQAETLNLRHRVNLDEHEVEQVTRALTESFMSHVQIEVSLFHKYEHPKVIGIVERIDQHQKRFMVDGEWFPFKDIEGARMLSSLEG
ncbi:YolD-like family protein [Paenibacillus sp. L3-i20]|uniref:YolD-like family protein n=1 Tax=Paenibacillus sp. L3-i20 TaxID=2905833 RepID=UPI001EDD8FD5|nr:YolD-like family protein [Paenibacillus sp. L3-i20]GKU80185.1 hypothetical protein L3i20_v245820 [Paenibacillus sp. L3-i20]